MGYKTTIYIALIAIGILLIVTYIRPTFEELKSTQDESAAYQAALDNARSFNAELARLQTAADSFSLSEIDRLETFLPDEIDQVVVMRDIETIARKSQLSVTELSAVSAESVVSNRGVVRQDEVEVEEEFEEFEGSDSAPILSQQFSVNVSGSYEQFKDFLKQLEKNKYLLEVVKLTFEASEGSLYTFAVTLETYSRNLAK